ncbi:MAG: carbonic anhydrase [Gammaproteobacteria bacterium RIFCSPHIGHO2_12_FULL_41_15]|nr:MAG: carbonic anhydrase [Gammaproteobacteria bacterium RIFCSPHIGHO2_12_FULL_41_15]
MKVYQRRYFKFDLTAGFVVFLVAIPLCLGIALASGAPLFSGIISGIIGGLIVGSISQSPVSVSGPAAGLIAIVLSAVAELGGFQPFLLALVFAGVLQILVGALRAGFIADYIPSNVVRGLLCAIGILIIIKQLPLAFTHTAQNQSLMQTLRESSENFDWQTLSNLVGRINTGASIIALFSLFVLFFFDKTKIKILSSIPGPVVVVFFGVMINELYDWLWPNLAQYSAQLVNIPVSNGLGEFFTQFKPPDFTSWKNINVYLSGFILAIVASLETLLNLEGATKLDKRRRYCSRNRELVAQGCGNLISGLIGGLPITSVVVRSSVNINSGAKTKFSTILHGFFILLVVMLIPNGLNRIPLAALAAILIHAGYKLTKPTIYKNMYKLGLAQFTPFIITVVAIVFSNLLMGILIGLFASFFFILKYNSQIRLDILNEKHPSGEVKRILLPQQISFLRKAALVAELENISQGTQLVIDARYTTYIDQDILELIEEFKEREAPDKNIALNLIGFKQKYHIHDRIDFINVTTYDVQSALNPPEVLVILKEGNQRFIKSVPIHRNFPDEIKATSHNQFPIAVVLSCIDSRMPIESVFDVGVGDVFVVRVAGNVINSDILASIEFACDVVGVKLILVLGHTRCGAIKAACDGVSGGHLTELLSKIKPAIQAEHQTQHDRTSENEHFLLNVTKNNVAQAMRGICADSTILRQLLNEQSVGLIGAIYDVRTGVVTFDQNFFNC